MKKLFTILCLFALSFSSVAADRVTVTITVTNIPAVSDTLVINATTRYWSNSVAALPAARILIGASIGASATNLWRQIATYPYNGMALATFTSSNIMTLKGSPGQTVSGSISVGTWGTVVLTTNTDTAAVVIRVPQSVEPNAVRTNSMTQLGADLGTYSQSALAAGTTLVSGLVQTTTAQTVAGQKTFSSDTVFSGSLHLSNAVTMVNFYNTSAPANQRWTQMYEDPVNGSFYFATLSDDGVTNNAVLAWGRTGADVTSFLIIPPLTSSLLLNCTVTNSSLLNSTIQGASISGTNYLPRVNHTALANGNNAGCVFTSVYTKIKAGPTAAFTINGIAGGADGRMLILDNSIAQNMTIANDSGVEPTAANRIYTRTGADVSTTAEGSVMLVYDSDSSRWIVINLQP